MAKQYKHTLSLESRTFCSVHILHKTQNEAQYKQPFAY